MASEKGSLIQWRLKLIFSRNSTERKKRNTPTMALLLPSSVSLFTSPSPPSVSSTHQCFNVATRLPWKSLSTSSLPFQKKAQVVTRVSSEASGEGLPPLENKGSSLSIENLPLQSTQQKADELRLKVKLEKKLRQRRRKLLLKRKMRKLGRWPLSKVKNKDGKKSYKKQKSKKKN